MQNRFTVGVLVVVVTGLAGCFHDGVDPTPTTVSTQEPNACTPFLSPGEVAVAQGDAFDFMLGLICDATGAQVTERARVPGTPEHADGAAYLREVLEAAGAEVRAQEFTGADYEAILKANPNNSAHGFYSSSSFCDPDDLPRMRALRFQNIEAKTGNVGGPIVLLMAHWDSKRFSDDGTTPVLGANDGAAGVGVLLEFASLRADESHFEIRILLTDGEDGFEDCHPLAGSTYYAENLPQTERARLDSIILLDMVGDADSSFHPGCGSDDELADDIWNVAADLAVPQFSRDDSCGGVIDDHTPFEERGMPAVDIIPSFPPYWHTPDDTPDKIDASLLADVGTILGGVLDLRRPDAIPILR